MHRAILGAFPRCHRGHSKSLQRRAQDSRLTRSIHMRCIVFRNAHSSPSLRLPLASYPALVKSKPIQVCPTQPNGCRTWQACCGTQPNMVLSAPSFGQAQTKSAHHRLGVGRTRPEIGPPQPEPRTPNPENGVGRTIRLASQRKGPLPSQGRQRSAVGRTSLLLPRLASPQARDWEPCGFSFWPSLSEVDWGSLGVPISGQISERPSLGRCQATLRSTFRGRPLEPTLRSFPSLRVALDAGCPRHMGVAAKQMSLAPHPFGREFAGGYTLGRGTLPEHLQTTQRRR